MAFLAPFCAMPCRYDSAVILIACFLAFYKVRDTDLHVDKYLTRLLLFRRRTHGYTYSRGRGEVKN